MLFKKWLLEVGGIGSGLAPILQRPDLYQGAFADYHDSSGRDPENQNGKLPPLRKKIKDIYNKKEKNGNKK